MSVKAPMMPHMLRPSHLPSSPVSCRAGASHACVSGQYSCSRYPLRKPAHASLMSRQEPSKVSRIYSC